MSVAVVGAGIVGLTTAAHIQELLPNVQVTIIADKFNTETTSDGAAGLFLPAGNFKGPTPSSAKDWMLYSYKYYEDLLKQDCGIFEMSGFSLSSQREEDVKIELLEGVIPEYRPATPQELLSFPGNWRYGTFMRTLLIRCRTFQPWLIERIKSRGGRIIKRTVHDFSELKDQYKLVVNCTGIQSKYLCNDNRVTSIRGQILKVKAPSVNQFMLVDGPDTYIIPNCDGLVSLGGTCQYNSWDARVRADESASIRARCSSVVPELASAPVAWEWAGLRPFREAVRVEPEIQNGLKMVHNYGHGGYGVTSAPGSARDAANYVVDLLQTQSKF